MRVLAVDSPAAPLVIGSGPSTGATFLANAIQGIKARRAAALARGETPKRELVIFDIDNTLVDSRYRTLEALHRFGIANRVPELANLAIDDVRIDGAATVAWLASKNPGLARFAIAAQAYWHDFFWDPANFVHDQALRGVLAWAKLAASKDVGAEVIYLTGRNDTLKNGTIDQLVRIGAPFADAAHVMTKPTGWLTNIFKRTVLHQLFAGANIGWFMSDSCGELKEASLLGLVPCVRLLFPIAFDNVQVDPRMPVLS